MLSPDELIEAAQEAGLDGICLTEHDFFWGAGEAAELGQRHGFLVIPGIEVNTEHGHITVFGLDRFFYGMHRLEELAAMATSAGAVMIANHPYRRQLPFERRQEGDWSEALARAARNPAYAHATAIESYNGRGSPRENAFARELAESLGLRQVAASDSHERADVGTCATEFERPIQSADDLIAELRAGRFRPLVLRERQPELR